MCVWSVAGGPPEKVYEIRRYQLKPECLGDYLALTGSPAFDARLEASRLRAFFLTEMGDTLNSVYHIWEYEDLDHRTEVRASLAGNAEFGGYLASIRPWLVDQHSYITRGAMREDLRPTLDGPTDKPGVFVLRRAQDGLEDDEETAIGHFRTIIGDKVGGEVTLHRAGRFEDLTDVPASVFLGHETSAVLCVPTAFSPLK